MNNKLLLIVVANTTQPNGPVLLQRRSSYQRILALENEQLQIVEREHLLPVDLFLSPSTCLIVYTAATMKINWRKNSGHAFKEISAFIDAIIINCHMKAMSYSFENCFVVSCSAASFNALEMLTVLNIILNCSTSSSTTTNHHYSQVRGLCQKRKNHYDYRLNKCFT